MMEPYSIEINIEKNRIIFHYHDAPDFVIDDKESRSYVKSDVNDAMPVKKELDILVNTELNATKAQIEKSKEIASEKKISLVAYINSTENRNKTLNRIINTTRSTIEKQLTEKFVKEKIKVLLKDDWKKLLSIKKEK